VSNLCRLMQSMRGVTSVRGCLSLRAQRLAFSFRHGTSSAPSHFMPKLLIEKSTVMPPHRCVIRAAHTCSWPPSRYIASSRSSERRKVEVCTWADPPTRRREVQLRMPKVCRLQRRREDSVSQNDIHVAQEHNPHTNKGCTVNYIGRTHDKRCKGNPDKRKARHGRSGQRGER
jgi:hypothetical protein